MGVGLSFDLQIKIDRLYPNKVNMAIMQNDDIVASSFVNNEATIPIHMEITEKIRHV